MKFVLSLLSGFFLLLVCSNFTVFPSKSTQIYVSDYENVLGTSLEIKVSATSPEEASAAENAAMSEIDRLNKILSGYDASSEFRKWAAGPKQAVKVSPELFEVLSLFDKWRVQTNGALDASAEVVGKVWKAAAKHNQLPTQAELAAAVAQVKQQHYVLDANNQTAQHLDDAALMLNTFTKSYIMNKACNAAMANNGVDGMVLNIGGDIVVRGEHREQINVSNPKADAENDAPVARLTISNKTVATSGNYRRGELIQGQWYSHIVDPRTGQPAGEVISATVVAPNPVDAGALATTLNVLKPEEGKKLMESMPNTEYMMITADGKRIESKGWKALEIPAIATPAKPAAILVKDKFWDPKYELGINLELAQIEGVRIHRPFVAIWVTDTDGKPVRSIALWYNKIKYLDEMRAWYSTYYDIFSAENSSISSTTSATRGAGQYTLKWDGKDDKGNLVKLGKYTINIEVAREHGTHQLFTQDMEFKKPEQITLTPNIEVAAASLDYHKIK
jgi:thiamine biosynthesis lipoprotein ApbE